MLNLVFCIVNVCLMILNLDKYMDSGNLYSLYVSLFNSFAAGACFIGFVSSSSSE